MKKMTMWKWTTRTQIPTFSVAEPNDQRPSLEGEVEDGIERPLEGKEGVHAGARRLEWPCLRPKRGHRSCLKMRIRLATRTWI